MTIYWPLLLCAMHVQPVHQYIGASCSKCKIRCSVVDTKFVFLCIFK